MFMLIFSAEGNKILPLFFLSLDKTTVWEYDSRGNTYLSVSNFVSIFIYQKNNYNYGGK